MLALKKFFFQRLFIFGTERDWAWTGEDRERGRHRIGNRLQAPSHQPRARRGARTHGPRDRDLVEVGRLTDCATQAPLTLDLKAGLLLLWHTGLVFLPQDLSGPFPQMLSWGLLFTQQAAYLEALDLRPDFRVIRRARDWILGPRKIGKG